MSTACVGGPKQWCKYKKKKNCVLTFEIMPLCDHAR